MNNHKQRVFIFARKRGIPFEVVRNTFREMGFPPTHSERKVVRKEYFVYKFDEGKITKIPASMTPANEYRDISREDAAKVIAKLS